jgi:hypothetical protein
VKWKCKSNAKEETLNSLLNASACGRIYAFGSEHHAGNYPVRGEWERESERQIKAHRISSLWALGVKKRDCEGEEGGFVFIWNHEIRFCCLFIGRLPPNMKSGLAKAATAAMDVAVN